MTSRMDSYSSDDKYVRTGGEVIKRAIQDDRFRELLFSNKEAALRDYKLTREEHESLMKLDRRTFEKTMEQIDSDLYKRLRSGGGEVPGNAWASLDCRAVNENA